MEISEEKLFELCMSFLHEFETVDCDNCGVGVGSDLFGLEEEQKGWFQEKMDSLKFRVV